MKERIAILLSIPAIAFFVAGCDGNAHSTAGGFEKRGWSSMESESQQSWHEGFAIEDVSPFGEEISLTSDQVHQLMNLWTWKVQLTVPEDCAEVTVYLDEYHRDRHVNTLAKKGFTRMQHRKDVGQPASDTFTLGVRFPDLENGRLTALRTAKSILFFADATQWNDNGGFDSPRRVENPFFKKKSVHKGLASGRFVDHSLEWRERRDEVDRVGAKRRQEFQFGLFNADDGTNLRATFRMGARYDPPGRSEENASGSDET